MTEVKQLSKHGFNNIHLQAEDGSSQSPSDKLVVQLLGYDENSKGCFNLVLSDGVTKECCITYKQTTEIFRAQKDIPNYSILEVDILFFKGNAMIIKGLSVLRTDVSRQIGDPMVYKDYIDGGRKERNIDCSIPNSRQNQNHQQAPQTQMSSNNSSFGNFKASTTTGRRHKSVILEDSAYHKISMIDQDCMNLTIKVVCKSKSPIRTWNNAKGTGELFNAVFYDESGSIQMTFFKEMCTANFDKIQPGGTYIISKFQANKANPKFNTTPHNFELKSFNQTQVEVCSNADSSAIKKPKPKIITLKQSEDFEPGKKFNTLVIIKEVHESENIMLRKARENRRLTKIDVIDTERSEMQLSYWGNNEQLDCLKKGDIVLLVFVRINVWNDSRSLAFDYASEAIVNPVEEAGDKLAEFITFKAQNNIDKLETSMLTKQYVKKFKPIIPISTVVNDCQELLDMPDGKKWFRICASVGRLKHNPLYMACTHCNKKCVNLEDVKTTEDEVICGKCGENTVITPKFLGSGRFSDSTGSIYVSFLNEEQGRAIYGMTAMEILLARLEDAQQYSDFLQKKHPQQFMVKIVAQMNEYNGAKSIRYRCSYIESGVEESMYMQTTMLGTLKEILGEVKPDN